ncbi:uncharacterized protein LOC135845911 [Planococcus citri]|uniref:uncharacterized protein LOC135845911 n=1 Tax=Planococcus citri TaxID=170843 RepID=UPI0031F82503
MDPRGTHGSQVQNETSSDEFVLYVRLPSLQEMAYSQIAISVWYRYGSTPCQQRDYGYEYPPISVDELELMDCHKLIKTLTMPRFMEETLKKYLKRVREETISCTQYFEYKLLSSDLYGYEIESVDWEYFVWCPDGRINYKSTAIKMLHSDVLTEVQKFAIMSDFCLENEIEIFDLNRLPMETFIPKVNEDSDYLLFYWIRYLWNETHGKIPFSFRKPSHYDRFSLTYFKSHGAAFDYYWNRLSAEDQVSFIRDRLCANDYSKGWHYSLFCKMSDDQLTKLLVCEPVAMISVFIKTTETLEWAITAWKRCKNWISNEQFVELLESVLHKSDKYPILHQEYKMSVLLEIWNTANDDHKNYAVRQAQLENAVVHPILSGDPHLWKKIAPSSFKFLLELLSLKSADFRKNLILKGDPSFICNFDFNFVHEIFELCLPNFQSNVEFKNDWSKHIIDPYLCEILYSEEDYDELNGRLLRSFQKLYISSNDFKKFIESLIIANKRGYKTYYPYTGIDNSDLIRLSEFINDILLGNVSTVLKMKQAYLSSFSAHRDPCERYVSLNELSKLIEQEFVHEHLQELKHRLAEKLQATTVEQWVSYVLNYEKVYCVFSWCYENEKEMFLQVKCCIPITNIVGKVLEGIVRQNTSSYYYFAISTFSNLERFLEWYFSGVAKEVISFKSSIKNDPENAKILEYTRANKNGNWLRSEFLNWNWPVK